MLFYIKAIKIHRSEYFWKFFKFKKSKNERDVCSLFDSCLDRIYWATDLKQSQKRVIFYLLQPLAVKHQPTQAQPSPATPVQRRVATCEVVALAGLLN